MDNSHNEIEDLEFALFAEMSRIQKQHKSLKEKLKPLLEELKITILTNRKLAIMKEMDEIEATIKRDLARCQSQKEIIEEKKREMRIQEYKQKTLEYQQEAETKKAQTNIFQAKSENNNVEYIFDTIKTETNKVKTATDVFNEVKNILSNKEKLLLAQLLLNDIIV